MKSIAVMASGSGSNFEAIVTACRSRKIAGQVVGLLVDTPKSQALARAERLNVPFCVIQKSGFANLADFDQAQLDQLKIWNPDLVVLAGYLKKVGPAVLGVFSGRILNIHPSLLPHYGGHGMYGDHVFNAVLAANERITGATVHWVDSEYDRGAIVAQLKLLIEPGETLESLKRKTHEIEHQLYIDVLNRICSETVKGQ